MFRLVPRKDFTNSACSCCKDAMRCGMSVLRGSSMVSETTLSLASLVCMSLSAELLQIDGFVL